jgi:CDP-diacylglycerol--glycerol-3-phosphate 3-phosphatidyltransferase
MLGIHARPQINRVVEPVARRIAAIGITPDALTIVGTIGVAGGALGFYPRGKFFVGTLVITAFVFSDLLDGAVARVRGSSGQWGAFLDSTLDRVEEGIVLTAVAAYFSDRGNELAVAAVVITVLMSLMVSYTRARAEALGVECKVGLATRPVRVVILSAGLLFAKGASLGHFELLEPAIYAMALLTTFTTLQRVVHVRRELNKQFAS